MSLEIDENDIPHIYLVNDLGCKPWLNVLAMLSDPKVSVEEVSVAIGE